MTESLSIHRLRRGRWVARFALLSAVLSFACEGDRVAAPPATPLPLERKASAPRPLAAAFPDVQRARYQGGERIIAIGDIHGDLDATRRALRLAGAIGDTDEWTGGALIVVQVGDQLDRGDGERAILDLFDTLASQAREAGGAVHSLNGNHETMNVSGDLRYVTPGGFSDFSDVPSQDLPPPLLSQLTDPMKGRVAAFIPGGLYARKLAERDVIAIVGDSVFVHGGVLPGHVEYGIDRINLETRAWMRGERPMPPQPIIDTNGPVWTRMFSTGADADCVTLGRVLQMLQVKRMVVGHTPQLAGATHACKQQVWRIDVGMAHYYGGHVEVLEITEGSVRILKETTDVAGTF